MKNPIQLMGKSTLNNDNVLLFNETLNYEGTLRNKGVDFTLERFLQKGFFGSVKASLYDSKYTPSDGIERNTHYNRNQLFNIVASKEWTLGKN